MHVNYRIIQAKDFVKVKPRGGVDLEESKKVLGQLAEMEQVLGGYEVLLDVREAYGNLNKDELWELILELGKHRAAFKNKIAVLTRNDEQFNKAVFVEMCATISGFKILAFDSFEQATNWLHSSDGVEDLMK
jgi:hypothetical protein